jgi:hypothetical protein
MERNTIHNIAVACPNGAQYCHRVPKWSAILPSRAKMEYNDAIACQNGAQFTIACQNGTQYCHRVPKWHAILPLRAKIERNMPWRAKMERNIALPNEATSIASSSGVILITFTVERRMEYYHIQWTGGPNKQTNPGNDNNIDLN